MIRATVLALSASAVAAPMIATVEAQQGVREAVAIVVHPDVGYVSPATR